MRQRRTFYSEAERVAANLERQQNYRVLHRTEIRERAKKRTIAHLELPHDLEGEVWRQIPGYEGYYSVSNLGRIKRDGYGPGTKIGKLLKHIRRPSGYMQVSLYKNYTSKTFNVHVLVGLAFLGQRPCGHCTNHKDQCKTNNCLDNLEYILPRENSRQSFEAGNFLRGERFPQAKLTEDKVREMRRLRTSLSMREIARRFGVSYAAAQNAIKGITWSHVRDK